MANELSQIDAWLYDLLTGDTELAAAVEGRVFADAAPKGTAFPFIVFNHYTGRDTNTLNRNRLLTRQVYQVKVITAGQNSSSAIADRIDELLRAAVNVEFEGYCYNSFRQRPVKMTMYEGERAFSHLGGFYEIQTYLFESEPEPPPTVLPLDNLAPAKGAYSVARRLLTSWSGTAFRVRRSSDNAEQDCLFVNDLLDTNALLAFVGGGNGFVTRIYDQSGNGNHLVQATASSQPFCVESGTLVVTNGKPAARNDGFRNLYSPVIAAASGWSASIHAADLSPVFFYSFLTFYPSNVDTGNGVGTIALTTGGGNPEYRLTVSGANVATLPAYATRNQYFLRVAANSVQTQLNGVATNATPTFSLANHFRFAFGGFAYSFPWNGVPHKTGEIVFWDSVISDADRDAYKTDMAAFWGVSV